MGSETTEGIDNLGDKFVLGEIIVFIKDLKLYSDVLSNLWFGDFYLLNHLFKCMIARLEEQSLSLGCFHEADSQANCESDVEAKLGGGNHTSIVTRRLNQTCSRRRVAPSGPVCIP